MATLDGEHSQQELDHVIVSFTHPAVDETCMNDCISCIQGSSVVHCELLLPSKCFRVSVTMDTGITISKFNMARMSTNPRPHTYLCAEVSKEAVNALAVFCHTKHSQNEGYNYASFCASVLMCVIPSCVTDALALATPSCIYNCLCNPSSSGVGYTCSQFVYDAFRFISPHILDPEHYGSVHITPARFLTILEDSSDIFAPIDEGTIQKLFEDGYSKKGAAQLCIEEEEDNE